MFKLMKKRIKNEKGLTLIEVLAVVVILAIVAMIAIPAIGGIIDNNRVKAIKVDAVNVISAANIYFTDGGSGEFTTSNKAGYLQNQGSIQDDFRVTREGKLYGTGTKGNVTIEFNGATVEDIDAENADTGENLTITKN